MPLAAGFVGIVPALDILRRRGYEVPEWDFAHLILWTLALGFFGVFFAVPLRHQTIVKEQLKFPSGTATAEMVELLHSSGAGNTRRWFVFTLCFVFSFAYSIIGFYVPEARDLAIFDWIGLHMVTEFMWKFTVSFGYIGQGMIMGGRAGLSNFCGAVLGWAILAPLSRQLGWAVGPVDDWETGAMGWIMWVSLSIMMAESLSSLGVLIVTTLRNSVPPVEDRTPKHHLVPRNWWIIGISVSSLFCVLVFWLNFSMAFYEPLVAVVFAQLVSLLAVRALGETDLNPVSGVGKMSQILFSVIAPGNTVVNVIAGGIAEAGAAQAGDLMQSLKTGYLVGTPPIAQFFGQLIGSVVSCIMSIFAYQLYSNAYGVPSETLPAPTAMMWVDMAELMGGGTLAHNVAPFCIAFALFGAALPILGAVFDPQSLPSGIAMAVGMYITPNWTLARSIGSLGQFLWWKLHPQTYYQLMIVTASGFVLGEGMASIVTAIIKSTS